MCWILHRSILPLARAKLIPIQLPLMLLKVLIWYMLRLSHELLCFQSQIFESLLRVNKISMILLGYLQLLYTFTDSCLKLHRVEVLLVRDEVSYSRFGVLDLLKFHIKKVIQPFKVCLQIIGWDLGVDSHSQVFQLPIDLRFESLYYPLSLLMFVFILVEPEAGITYWLLELFRLHF